MSLFKILNKSPPLRHHYVIAKRFILSPAYRCTGEWNKRLEEPMIKDLELDSFFYQLNEKLVKKTSITPADVDIYLNRASVKNLSEVINVMQRFRKNWRSYAMLDSTRHAFIRILLDNGDFDRLVDILSKRVEFGAFPDKFTYNMVLDSLIEAGQLENGAKVAVLRMLQEDFESEIGNYLSLKAIHAYLTKNDAIKEELFANAVVEDENEEAKAESDDEESDEIEYIRVPYLRNPYFDDHFDIKDTWSLLGKTYWLVGDAIKDGQHSELSDNCIVFGLILYKKWDQVNNFLAQAKQLKLSSDLVQLVEKFVASLTEKDAKASTANDDAEDDAEKANEANPPKPSVDVEKAGQILGQLKAIHNVSTSTFEQMIDGALATIGPLESEEINELKATYKEYTRKRTEKMKSDLDALLRLEIIDQIKERKREMKEREEKLYFFENIERLQLLEHEAVQRIEKAEESMKIEEEYIPPRVRR